MNVIDLFEHKNAHKKITQEECTKEALIARAFFESDVAKLYALVPAFDSSDYDEFLKRNLKWWQRLSESIGGILIVSSFIAVVIALLWFLSVMVLGVSVMHTSVVLDFYRSVFSPLWFTLTGVGSIVYARFAISLVAKTMLALKSASSDALHAPESVLSLDKTAVLMRYSMPNGSVYLELSTADDIHICMKQVDD